MISHLLRYLLPGAAALVLSACVHDPAVDARTAQASCEEDLLALERRARAAGLNPGSPAPVPGFPELGTNRALASFAGADLSPTQREDWLQRLFEAGADRRRLLMLGQGEVPGYDSAPVGGPAEAGFPVDLERCAAQLFSAREWTEETRAALAAGTAVSDAYVTAYRVFGLYPLTSLPVRSAVRRLQAELTAEFAMPLEALPVTGALHRFEPDVRQRSPAGDLFAQASDSLGVRLARIETDTLEHLFARHAPVLEVDVGGAFDYPGVPVIDAEGERRIDESRAAAYHYATVMPFAGRLRLQLVYVFWFPERPKTSSLDTLGGDFDGITWRITLDDQGDVLLYDSIHPCGCYHQFFPGEGVVLRAAAKTLPEPPLLPQPLPSQVDDERLVLRLASGTHYLQRVYPERSGARGGRDEAGAEGEETTHSYSFAPYDSLYGLTGAAGEESFFDDRGFVPGSRRGERFYLWPMGVPSPGAMRDRGRQATAFLGRRHFDDADLLDSLFRLAPNP